MSSSKLSQCLGRVPIDHEYKSVEEKLSRRFAYHNTDTNRTYISPARTVNEQNKKFAFPKINQEEE
jgi:hypothetical protein